MDMPEPKEPSRIRLARRQAINIPQSSLIQAKCRVALAYLPFANLYMPSIGLTQLKSAMQLRFQDEVAVDLNYLTFDFAHYLGLDLYNSIVTKPQHNNAGLSEWIFRHIAFPEAPDNTAQFYQRFYPWQDPQTLALKRLIEEKRQGLDAFMQQLVFKYQLDKANVVGLSSMFHQNLACFALARKIKDANPNVIVVMGGANCEAPMGPAIVQHVPQIDFAFSGPALKSFPDFIQAYLDQRLDTAYLINGVYTKPVQTGAAELLEIAPGNEFRGRASRLAEAEGGGVQVMAPPVLTLEPVSAPRPHGTHGDELDINAKIELDYEPFLDAIETNFPNGEVKPVLTFETSRGCWWGEKAHCTFCGLNDLTIRARTMKSERAIETFNALAKYASRCSRYLSVDNILPKSFVKEVFPYLDLPEDMVFLYESKSDMDEEGLQVLSKVGVKLIQPGIEALSNRSLKLMHKGSTVFVNLRLLKNCLLYEIYPAWNILIGTPGEEEDIYAKYVRDIPLLVHLPPPTGSWPVEFHRFSPNFDNAEALGLDLHPREYCLMSYPFPEEIVKEMVWHFEDRNVNALHFVQTARWLGKIREQIDAWQARWDGRRDDLPAPHLYMHERDGATWIYDTRSGAVVEYPLPPVSVKVLEYLARPATAERLAAHCADIAGFDPEAELAFLQERGLLFEEEGSYMTLALPRPPLPRRRWDQWPTGWYVF